MKFKITIHRLEGSYNLYHETYHGIIAEKEDHVYGELNVISQPANKREKAFHAPSMGQNHSWYNTMYVDGGELDESTVKQVAEQTAQAVAKEYESKNPIDSRFPIQSTLKCREWDIENSSWDNRPQVQFYRSSFDFGKDFRQQFLKNLEAAKLAAKTKATPDAKASACLSTLVHNMQGNGAQVRAESKTVSPVDAVKNLLTERTKLPWKSEYSESQEAYTFFLGKADKDKLTEESKAIFKSIARFNQANNTFIVPETEINTFVKTLLDAINKPILEQIAQNTETAKQLQARKETLAKELQQVEQALLQVTKTGNELEQALVAVPEIHQDQPAARLAV